MKHLSFAILLWSDRASNWHGQWVEDLQSGLATGESPQAVLEQLRSYLEKSFTIGSPATPDLAATELHTIPVAIQPEYKTGQRVMTASHTLTLRVPCVRGRDSTGLWTCYIPTLSINFTFRESSAFKSLVQHYVRDRLAGHTPLQLSRYIHPPETQLERITLRLPEEDPPAPRQTRIDTRFAGILEEIPVQRGAGIPHRCWEREAQSNDLAQRIFHGGSNILLVAPAGAGKTSLLFDAIRHLKHLHGKSSPKTLFYRTSANRLISGMKYLGQWEQRCEQAIQWLLDHHAALHAENLLDLVSAGGNNPSNSIAAFLAPYLERAELRLISEATPQEVDACRRLLPGFADLFNILTLTPFTAAQSVRILDKSAQVTGRNACAQTAPGVAQTVYRLFSRFEPYRAFPGPAVNFLDTLLRRARHSPDATITPADVLDQFTRRTGLPQVLLRDDLPLTRQDVVAPLLARVIGQDDACRAVADTMLTFKAGLCDPGRPLGVFLFCGPTGVGKTELARALSNSLFEQNQEASRLIRLDMSEFAGPACVERFLGNPLSGPSQIVQSIRRQPFSVLLLDEIEKADPRIFDLLLTVFDEGRLTDSLGRATHFNSCLIIMTSNLGAAAPQAYGFGAPPAVDYHAHAMAFFRPEFVNRIDRIVPFSPLQRPAILRIVEKELAQLSSREGLSRRAITLTWTSAVAELLLTHGFDPRYGARPLQRALETHIVNPLAAHLLAHPALANTTLRLHLHGGSLAITGA